jgi:hypothetical protein
VSAGRLVLAVALVAGIAVSPAGGRATQPCLRQVTGGSTAEQAAVRRILCLMPGTAIQSVQILDEAPDAPANALWLAMTIPRPPQPQSATFLSYSRAHWEVEIAAAGIRDGLSRLGLAHVVAYQELASGATPGGEHLVGIARPEWDVPRWSTGAPVRTLGRAVGTWAQLQVKLDALSRRFGVRTRLERYSPFGKAPVVTVTTDRGGAFIDAGGFQAYEQALRFGEARFDGVFLQLITPAHAGLQVFTVDRGRRSSGCSGSGRIPHRRYEICPSD